MRMDQETRKERRKSFQEALRAGWLPQVGMLVWLRDRFVSGNVVTVVPPDWLLVVTRTPHGNGRLRPYNLADVRPRKLQGQAYRTCPTCRKRLTKQDVGPVCWRCVCRQAQMKVSR